MKSYSLEDQLRMSVHAVQARKREDIETWLDVTPMPPKRLKRKKMSEQQAIVKHQEPASELATWRAMREQAKELVQSGFLPKAVNTPEKAMAIIQTGKELGLGPMQSLRSIHIIEGKPTMSADLIAGLALANVPGSVLRVAETTDAKCVIKAGRAGSELTTFTYTMADAQRAGLTNKQNWRNYPRAMLRARAITEAARAIFPDAVMGLYDPDELGAVTTPAGEMIQVTDITPHAAPDEDARDMPKSSEAFDSFMSDLQAMDKEAFDPGCTWDSMSAMRRKLGKKGTPTPFSQSLSNLYQSEEIAPSQRKDLAALWNRVDRKLTALEGKLKPPSVESSFVDEPNDDTDAFGPEPAAE